MSSFDEIRGTIAKRREPAVVSMPGNPTVDVGVRLLTEQQIDDAKLAAQRYTKERGADIDLDPEFYDREKVRQVLWRACVSAEQPDEGKDRKPFFPSPRDLHQVDSQVVEGLFEAYVDLQHQRSVFVDPDDAVVERTADLMTRDESSANTLLSHYDAPALRMLIRSLCKRLITIRDGEPE